MKIRLSFLMLFVFVAFGLFAQPQLGAGRDDGEVAQQYVQWVKKAVEEEKWDEALSAIERAADFANVSSDISYLLALVYSYHGVSRFTIIEDLDTAIETNRWVSYNVNQAYLLKAKQLVAMRNYTEALFCIDMAGENADSAVLRLLAFRGLANSGDIQALTRFRSLVLSTMDRYSRDPRPLRIFFEYARNRNPQSSDLPASDVNLLELALRRLPFLLETDPDLAWIAAPFMRDTEAAIRLVASYRAGGLTNKEYFRPSSGSIVPALNLGLISDIDAVEEFFGEDRIIFLRKDEITDIYNLLRSEEGRDLFTRKLFSFSGEILSDEDRDGFYEGRYYYISGTIKSFVYDINQSDFNELSFSFDNDGIPFFASYLFPGESPRWIYWERYPSVQSVHRPHATSETFRFRPVDFQFAPIKFIELGGSQNLSGLSFPVLSDQYVELSSRSLISFCSSLSRPSTEIDGAEETIYMERGVILRVIETKDEKQVSVTEFERGLPTVQHIDLDLDGRMETVRHFRRPPADYVWEDFLDYRRLIASSESDWSGDGRYKTKEVYRPDGSVVYSMDMDGSGTMEINNE